MGYRRSCSSTTPGARPGLTRTATLSCSPSRTGRGGTLIDRGRARLARRAAHSGSIGQYWLQAAIVAEHARAATAEETNWLRICQLYEHLLTVTRSPIVALNRAIAVSMADGPAAGLRLLEPLIEKLNSYSYLHAARLDIAARSATPCGASPPGGLRPRRQRRTACRVAARLDPRPPVADLHDEVREPGDLRRGRGLTSIKPQGEAVPGRGPGHGCGGIIRVSPPGRGTAASAPPRAPPRPRQMTTANCR